jgi:GNAT superfamily N-acetyltransferase
VVHGVLIRPAAPSDLDGVGEVVGSADRVAVRLQAAERGDDGMLVAEVSSRIVGVASVRWSNPCDAPNPWLYGLHDAAEARRRGIGRALVEAAEELGRRRGAEHMSLDVDVDDAAAIAFYETLGYAVVRRHRHRWRSVDPRTGRIVEEGTAPILIMRRRL